MYEEYIIYHPEILYPSMCSNTTADHCDTNPQRVLFIVFWYHSRLHLIGTITFQNIIKKTWFIEYHLKRIPLANIATSPEAYKAGTFQMAGELWNSMFYLVDKVSLFDWYATKTSDKPETLYYQPRNKNEHILQIVGELRESQ